MFLRGPGRVPFDYNGSSSGRPTMTGRRRRWAAIPVGSCYTPATVVRLRARRCWRTCSPRGIAPSLSRPHVSDDNPYSEALFRVLEYPPEFSRDPFANLEAARQWVEDFVAWYNTEHLHSAISFVRPQDRHTGRDIAILAGRQRTYQTARKRNPERWARVTRNWERLDTVTLIPERKIWTA